MSLSHKLLAVYSAIMTIVGAAATYAVLARPVRFDEIDVQRINIVEPDGTKRLVISNNARFPGSFFNGKEVTRPDRRTTGMLFMNDEGTEMGGLIYGSRKEANGQIFSNGHLSFDQYDQDQVLAIDAGQVPQKRTLLVISDRGDWSLSEAMPEFERMRNLPPDERREAMQEFTATHGGAHTRVVMGRQSDGASVLRLSDLDGHERLVLAVAPDGAPTLTFLDAQGHVIDQLPRAATKTPPS